MDTDFDENPNDENAKLLTVNSESNLEKTSVANSEYSTRTSSLYCSSSSDESVTFDSKFVKTSTCAGDLAATWGGRKSQPELSRRRRTRSWSAGPTDESGNSEIRILRER